MMKVHATGTRKRSPRRISTRIITAVLLLSITLPVLAGCTTSSATDNLTVGIVQLVEHPALDASREGFIEKLDELAGDSEITYVVENAQNEQANAVTIANQFAARDDLDLVLAIATPAAEAVVNAVTDIPVLFTAVTDAVEAHLVDSNEKPGGNVTGTSDMSPIKEQIDLLVELVPDAGTVGIVYSSSEVNSQIQAELAEAAARELGLAVVVNTASNSNEIQQVTEATASQSDALWIPTDNGFASAAALVGQVAIARQIPVITGEANMLTGGLATVAIDYFKLGEQTAEQARKILFDDIAPADIPVEMQADPQLTVNETFAAAIGFEIPEAILSEAVKFEPDAS